MNFNTKFFPLIFLLFLLAILNMFVATWNVTSCLFSSFFLFSTRSRVALGLRITSWIVYHFKNKLYFFYYGSSLQCELQRDRLAPSLLPISDDKFWRQGFWVSVSSFLTQHVWSLTFLLMDNTDILWSSFRCSKV